jgi:hypothetical protein
MVKATLPLLTWLLEMKPRIFIGSSKEGQHIANAIHAGLQRDAECRVWTEGVFRLSENNLQSLMRAVRTSEFGIFVFSPDDVVETRGKLFSVPRDNVVYELGLFSGALGPERCFFLTPLDSEIHVASDLLGITPGAYETGRRDEDMEAAVGPFCVKVRQKLKELWLDVCVLDPKPNTKPQTGWQAITFRCTPRPGRDVFLFTEHDNGWWPRRERLKQTTDNVYETKTFFGGPGRHTIHIVRANDLLGVVLLENYFYFTDQLKKYPSITTGELPHGFVSLASVPVEVVPKPT